MKEEELPTPTHSGQLDSLSLQKQKNKTQTETSELATILWTPTFIALFTLTLVVGLSMTTILIQGWLNAHYSDTIVLLAYTPLLLFLWIAVLVKARSAWTRAGASFGCLWSFFTAGSFWLHSLVIDPQAANVTQMNIATNGTLLGMSLCLSLAHTPFQRWDNWFFRSFPLFAIAILGADYLHISKETQAFSLFESFGATLLLYLSSAIWWLRPSCWRNQAGPTFLFGSAPLILIIFVIPNLVSREQVFFFQQIFLLCILLGATRILQSELRA
jgi:hypothetical protein